VKNYSVVGIHWGLYTRVMPDLVRSTHKDLVDLYEAGEIDPLISGIVPFNGLPDALQQLGERGTYGKVITRPAAQSIPSLTPDPFGGLDDGA
jgi:NADPH2:quinone reductase